MNILITGCAGFIGFHLSNRLLEFPNVLITGIDNINNYYRPSLKIKRLNILKKKKNFCFYKYDINDKNKISLVIKNKKINYVIHLAAQAGVRFSIKDPETYFENNIKGFFNILNLCKKYKVKHLIFASTSSVYGANNDFPLKETSNTDKPLSFYAASKKSNEVMAYSFSNMYNLPTTALRFFTIYGPYGRPDMSLFKFTDAILNKSNLNLYNNGKHYRDFTYIDDAVDAIISIIRKPSNKKIPFNCFNIGNGKTKTLKYFLNLIEKSLGMKTNINKLPLQKGDVIKTHADISLINKYSFYEPKIELKQGILNFLEWYKSYFKK